jgi:hypothetical protein
MCNLILPPASGQEEGVPVETLRKSTTVTPDLTIGFHPSPSLTISPIKAAPSVMRNIIDPTAFSSQPMHHLSH